ncbi:MAG: VPLPA-CTERM sorting domain-containing protein [Methylococcales bacterium]|nr:VPLPA-CTERM sorting domain-containing protein [Methylococcales bacterium]
MKKVLMVFITVFVLLGSSQVFAVTLTQWGTSVEAASADCSNNDCSKLGFLFTNPIIQDQTVGGLNQSSAALLDYENLDGKGTVSASAQVQGSFAIPVLKAKAESVDADGWVSATSWGIQGYQFTGADNTTISLDSSLTGEVNNTSGSDVTGLSVGVWLLAGDSGLLFPDAPDTFNDLLFQIAFLPGSDSFSWENLTTETVNRSTTTTDLVDQLDITLDNGDEFYLLAGLTASADGTGAFADAFSTLEMSFNSTNLTPAAVPLPAGIWLFVSALAGLIAKNKYLS